MAERLSAQVDVTWGAAFANPVALCATVTSCSRISIWSAVTRVESRSQGLGTCWPGRRVDDIADNAGDCDR